MKTVSNNTVSVEKESDSFDINRSFLQPVFKNIIENPMIAINRKNNLCCCMLKCVAAKLTNNHRKYFESEVILYLCVPDANNFQDLSLVKEGY